jgi:hypothetical protein
MSSEKNLKSMVDEDDDENEQAYLSNFRENNGSGLINTRISDRENEV